MVPPRLLLLGLVLSVACRAHGGRGSGEACEPVTGSLDAAATEADLAGQYRLTLVATAGPETGSVAHGTLRLQPQEPRLRAVPGPTGDPYPGVTLSFIGTLDASLDSVGGYTAGSLTATDPRAPGVAALVQRDAITLRLGAEANRRGVFAFDGPYAVLRVRAIGDDGFRGSWTSGATQGVAAEGYFCAVRRDE